MPTYTPDFFDQVQAGALRSARAVVPFLLPLLRPRSVVDVGCGRGAWLAVFREQGVSHVLGIDGTPADPGDLALPPECFLVHDLTTPLRLSCSFDLALSLEVAEHLPAASAQTLVDSLVRLAPLVLFSAAVPGQGGTHHVNEQWPEYWANLFLARDYHPIDCLRRHFWCDPRVEWWYSQNMLLYARLDCLLAFPSLKHDFALTDPSQLAIVHPRCLLTLTALLRQLSHQLHRLEAHGTGEQGNRIEEAVP